MSLPSPPNALIRLVMSTEVVREDVVVLVLEAVALVLFTSLVVSVVRGRGRRGRGRVVTGTGVVGVVATGPTVRVTPTLRSTLLLLLKLPPRTFRVTRRRVVTPLVAREMFLHVEIPTPPEVNRCMSR